MAMTVSASTHPGVGSLVREWRLRRRRSQMDLALDAGLSPRHLSFVETGRSKPSPELLLALADELEVPLRERNQLLLAAGYAPHYSHTPLDDQSMTRARRSIQQMLDRHDPYPGIAVDRLWNVMLANASAQRLTSQLPPQLQAAPLNVFRACLHPDGLSQITVNFSDWANYLLGQLRRVSVQTADPAGHVLYEEVTAYPNVRALTESRRPPSPNEPVLLVPWQITIDETVWSLFTTITSFGTPTDITLDELAVELFYPADDATETALRQTQPPWAAGDDEDLLKNDP